MFMERLCKLIAQISMFISASCAGVLTVVMILQIFCRKVLNNSLSWSDEMGGYLLVWIALKMSFIKITMLNTDVINRGE